MSTVTDIVHGSTEDQVTLGVEDVTVPLAQRQHLPRETLA